MDKKIILAFVGMPGAGKSEAVSYIQKKNIPFVRFGQITDEGVKALGLPLTTENEKMVREKLRAEFGMGAYALKAQPKIEALLSHHNIIAINGLYSWEEYDILKKIYPNLLLVHVFAGPALRYKRLTERPIRPIALNKSRERDIAELQKLNKGGPIAMADYLLKNDKDLTYLHKQIDELFSRLHILI